MKPKSETAYNLLDEPVQIVWEDARMFKKIVKHNRESCGMWRCSMIQQIGPRHEVTPVLLTEKEIETFKALGWVEVVKND